MQSAGSAAATRSSRSLRRSCGLHGIATAPIRKQASIEITHSIRLPTSVITTSSRWTPRAASAPESPALIANSSLKCQTRRSPAASIASSAGFPNGKR